MDAVVVGDEVYGKRAANQLNLPYQSSLLLGENVRYISVIDTVEEWKRIKSAYSTYKELAVIVCSRDCRPLAQLIDKVEILFGGIPHVDHLHAVLEDTAKREEFMAAERRKIEMARFVENLISQESRL